MESLASSPYLVFDFVEDDERPRRQLFLNPVEIITTNSLAEVRSCLREVQRGVDQGLYAAGYVSYDAAPALDSSLSVRSDSCMPLVWFGLFHSPVAVAAHAPGPFHLSAWESTIERSRYDRDIAEIIDAIRRGDTYQVNYTFRLRARFEGDDYAFYHRLVDAQRASYCAYLNLGRHRILSISPELFFQRRGSSIIARPMKGTMKRGRWSEEDTEFAAQLFCSEKNRAENVMIVDLVRNDLGRIADTASVEVTRLFEIQRFPTLWQMTSTIAAKVRPELTLEDVFTALFPSGSVTGAPKVNTMKIITNLEDSSRNVYCGSVGFVTPKGDATFNVAIRTVTIDTESGLAEYGVGGGITWDSTSEDEYLEAVNKAAVLVEGPPEFELLETMRLEHGSFCLLEGHLERLQASARYFGFTLSLARVRQELAGFSAGAGADPLRVRLLVSRHGQIRIESRSLAELPGEVVPVTLASRPVSRRDPFLFHKTTERRLLDELKAECPNSYDVLLWNSEREPTEFSTGNLVAKINGELITPPLESGLLAGTMRAQLLSEGIIHEHVLTMTELYAATDLWLINSVRGWVPVRLEPKVR
jgi:para-aminobenzoate synthetase/4-amino-4-deoxychorismate lyase